MAKADKNIIHNLGNIDKKGFLNMSNDTYMNLVFMQNKAYRLACLAMATTEYEDRTPAAFPDFNPFTLAENLVFLLEDDLSAMREVCHEKEIPAPDAVLSQACAIATAAANMALDAENDREKQEDFFSLLYPLADTVMKLAVEFDALT